jgi:hypothetical protein
MKTVKSVLPSAAGLILALGLTAAQAHAPGGDVLLVGPTGGVTAISGGGAPSSSTPAAIIGRENGSAPTATGTIKPEQVAARRQGENGRKTVRAHDFTIPKVKETPSSAVGGGPVRPTGKK